MRFEGLQNEILARTGATYFAEAAIGIIIGLVFFHFTRLYDRGYLKTWAASWLFFALASFALGFGSWYGYSRFDFIRFTSTFLTQTGYFLHIFFLLAGLLEFIRNKKINSSSLLIASIIIALASFLLVWVSNSDLTQAGSLTRYLFRVIIRYMVVSFGFFVAAIIAMRSPLFKKGLGQKILVSSFFLYGLTYGYYFIVALSNYFGSVIQFPFFFGMIELVIISATGLGMIMWLLEDERERLNKLNKELDSFLYSASHDLRAPIASILGLTNLTKLETKDERALYYTDIIENRVKKLDMVIGDILKLSRSKNVELKFERIDFNNLLKQIIDDVKFHEKASSIKLIYNENESAVFYSDHNQIKIVLNNLISNAVKYHNTKQEEPYIKVLFSRIGKSVQIIVEDNGRGIAQRALPKVFDMFYRASSDTSGTGLGLYIVKEALSKINGSISVDSKEGQGTTFTIVLANA